MLKKAKWAVKIFIIALFVAGCASHQVIDKSDARKVSDEKRTSIFSLLPSDTDIINAALSCLSTPGKEPDYDAARAKLQKLTDEYPHSKWFDSAQALLLTIDDLLDLQSTVINKQQELDKANAEKSKLLKEKDALRRDYNNLEDRYQTETAKLQQENEQLKRDISLLKRLEIQLDKREKMLK